MFSFNRYFEITKQQNIETTLFAEHLLSSQYMMVRQGKAMRLITDSSDKIQGCRITLKPKRAFLIRNIDLFLLFSNADHRKILDHLSQQYDLDSKSFKEVNYNKIIKECRIGNNKAKEYLNYLTEKGLIKRKPGVIPFFARLPFLSHIFKEGTKTYEKN